MKSGDRIFTFGHPTRMVAELVALLQESAVTQSKGHALASMQARRLKWAPADSFAVLALAGMVFANGRSSDLYSPAACPCGSCRWSLARS